MTDQDKKDLKNLVWHRKFYGAIKGIKYTAKDIFEILSSIGFSYTLEQVTKTFNQEKLNDCSR